MIMITIWIITLALLITSGIKVWHGTRYYKNSNVYFIIWAILSITNISVVGHILVSEMYIVLKSLNPIFKFAIPILLITTGFSFANFVLSFMHRFGSLKIAELFIPPLSIQKQMRKERE